MKTFPEKLNSVQKLRIIELLEVWKIKIITVNVYLCFMKFSQYGESDVFCVF
jgi:hypothetical protein